MFEAEGGRPFLTRKAVDVASTVVLMALILVSLVLVSLVLVQLKRGLCLNQRRARGDPCLTPNTKKPRDGGASRGG